MKLSKMIFPENLLRNDLVLIKELTKREIKPEEDTINQQNLQFMAF